MAARTEPITRLRGRDYRYRDAVLVPTYHPAYLLRNPEMKRDVWEDMKRVRAILQG
jgi:uracil-DNA glycosylase